MAFVPHYKYNDNIYPRIYDMRSSRYYPCNFPHYVSNIISNINKPDRINILTYFTNGFTNGVFSNVIMELLLQLHNDDFEILFLQIYNEMVPVAHPYSLEKFKSNLWEYCNHLPTLRQKIESDGYVGNYTSMFKLQYQINYNYIWEIVDRVPKDYVIDFFLYYHDSQSLERFLTKEEITEELFERAILFPTDIKKEYQEVAYWIGKQIQLTKHINLNFLFLLALTLEDILMANKLYAKYKFELDKEILGIMGKHGSKKGFTFVFKRIKNVNKYIYICFTANQACLKNQKDFIVWLIDNYKYYEITIADSVIDEMIRLKHFDSLKVIKNSIKYYHYNNIYECNDNDFLIWFFNNFNIIKKPDKSYAGIIWQKMKDDNTKRYYQKMFKTMWDQKLPIAEWIIEPLIMQYLVKKEKEPLF